MFKRFFKNKLAFFGCVFLLFSCAPSTVVQDQTLKIVLDKENYNISKSFFDSFSKKYPELQVEFEVLDEDSIDYFLRHDNLNGDIVLLTDLTKVNNNAYNFYDFTASDYLFEFRRYVQNFLMATDDNIYCLPSPGNVYYYCANMDIFNKLNLNLPNTLGDLVDFCSGVKNGEYQAGGSVLPNDMKYLDAFLQATVGSFFSKTEGCIFLDQYLKGDNFTYIQDSPYLEDFLSCSRLYVELFRNDYIDRDKSAEENIQDFMEGKTAILSCSSSSFNFIDEYNKAGASFNYEFFPYLGNNENRRYLPSTTDFFVSVLKKSFTTENRMKIQAFLEYFSSQEGQSYLLKDENGNTIPDKISYLKDNNLVFHDKYASFNKWVNYGNVFLVDKFKGAFSWSLSQLKDYSYEKIQDYAFVQSLDLNMKNHLLYQANEYKLSFLEGYDSSSKEFKDALLLYFYDFFKKKYNLNLLCFPYDFIQQPIFEQTIYENDLDIVFDKNLDLVPYYINGKELKIIVDYLGNDSDYFYRGATKNSKGEFILENKNSIVDGKEYMVIVPDGLDKQVGFNPTRCGDTIHAVSFVFSSLEEAKRR